MEQRDRKQKVKQKSRWLLILGKSGIIQSLLFHIFVILFLALSFTVVNKEHTVKLCINFEPDQPDLSVDPIQIEIPQPEFEQDSSLTEVVIDQESENIQIDPLADFDHKPNTAVENITSEVINSTFTKIDVASSTISRENRTTGTESSSMNRFNSLMRGKLDERLAKHGANSGDIQISISWDDYNDIDLWVEFEPFNFRNHKHLIGWTHRESINGGYLDIDMNVQPFTNEAVENIVWPKNRSPYGTYTVYAHYYHQWDRNNTTQIYLRVQADDKVTYKKSIVTFGNGPQKLYTFTRRPSKK